MNVCGFVGQDTRAYVMGKVEFTKVWKFLNAMNYVLNDRRRYVIGSNTYCGASVKNKNCYHIIVYSKVGRITINSYIQR